MKLCGGYDLEVWYQAFAEAAQRESKRAEDRLRSTVYAQQGVPALLPLVAPDAHDARYQGTCESLIQELLLHTLLAQNAQSPDAPTTNEVAHAETLVASIALSLAGFPLDAEALDAPDLSAFDDAALEAYSLDGDLSDLEAME